MAKEENETNDDVKQTPSSKLPNVEGSVWYGYTGAGCPYDLGESTKTQTILQPKEEEKSETFVTNGQNQNENRGKAISSLSSQSLQTDQSTDFSETQSTNNSTSTTNNGSNEGYSTYTPTSYEDVSSNETQTGSSSNFDPKQSQYFNYDELEQFNSIEDIQEFLPKKKNCDAANIAEYKGKKRLANMKASIWSKYTKAGCPYDFVVAPALFNQHQFTKKHGFFDDGKKDLKIRRVTQQLH